MVALGHTFEFGKEQVDVDMAKEASASRLLRAGLWKRLGGCSLCTKQEKAVKLCQQAAEGGDSQGILHLDRHFQFGKVGIGVDNGKEASRYAQTSGSGVIEATRRLGGMQKGRKGLRRMKGKLLRYNSRPQAV